MKQKTHSGSKKRVKVNGKGKAFVQKACKRHLLTNKSKGQKAKFDDGMPVCSTRTRAVRRMMPGKVRTPKSPVAASVAA